MEHIIDECKGLYDKVVQPDRYPMYQEIAYSPTLPLAAKVLDFQRKTLMEAREELQDLWQKAEGRVLLAAKVMKYKTKALKVRVNNISVLVRSSFASLNH